MAREFAARGIGFARETQLPVFYKGEPLNTSYRADFVCYDAVIVEVKALAKLSGTERAQIINYLKASGLQVGLLLNFGTPSLGYERCILSSTESADEHQDYA